MEGTPNFKNRTLYHGDNLQYLRGINSNTVDLIATDPPFNKGRDFHATPDSLAKGASFQDRWSWSKDVEQAWIDKLEGDFPNVYHVIQGSRKSYGDDMGAFLCFMGVRLLEMKRVLKDTGSIYLHCDPTASHYLKELMDAIFGHKNFLGDIIWNKCNGVKTRTRWGNENENILCYAKQFGKHTFNSEIPDLRIAYSDISLSMHFKNEDDEGRLYRKRTVNNKDYIYYADEGRFIGNLWNDIPSMIANTPIHKESTGHPTQKPVQLYKRIIKASSNPGDVVLDPFCGCATTCVAAELLGRQWIGIDLWDMTQKITAKRLVEEGKGNFLDAEGEGREGSLDKFFVREDGEKLYTPKKPPERTDDKMEAVPFLTIKIKKYEKEDKTAKLSNSEMKALLIQENGGQIKCGGCNRIFDHEAYLELDHRNPRSNGGANSSFNRVLLCSPCNKKKSNKMLLIQLVKENQRSKFWKD